ncbi:MAG: hypothetical protein ACR2N9_08300 [Acidimicrobiia bacterium]
MTSRIDTLLLLALPASGKSELRRYLASVDPDAALADFGLGPTVQLDDYPYVHLMRRISQELRRLDATPVFFVSDDQPFLDGRDWGTLIELVNEDYAALGTEPAVPAQPTAWMLDRFDRARRIAGIDPPFDDLPDEVLIAMAVVLDTEIAAFARERTATLASFEAGVSTVLIEFARGGPDGWEPPLPDPHGYQYSLRYLSEDILRRASALHVWVTPEESRRRNVERAVPGIEGDASILHHGVPEPVMLGDYGVDDFPWLLERGDGTTIDVEVGDAIYHLPAAVFDNRIDHTSFLRADRTEWDSTSVNALNSELLGAFAELA